MSILRRLGVPALAGGLLLTTGAAGQVIEDRPAPAPAPSAGRPVTTTDRPVAVDQDTAVLTDADRTGTARDGEYVRRVSEILSGEARGPGDEGRIAAISDLIMDGEGNPHYILLSRGGVAGVGGDKIVVPFDAAQLSYVEDGGWRLPLTMTGEQLGQAPTLEDGSLASLRDANWIQTNRQFFQADAAGGHRETGDDTFLFLASALKDAQVHGRDRDDSIANVDDVLLGPDFQASHAILGYGGVAGLGKNQVPVPFNMLRLSAETDNDRYRLVVGTDLTKERLQSDTAPTLDGEYNRMIDPTFIERVDSYFGAAGATGTTGAGTIGTPGTGTVGTPGTGTVGTPGTAEPLPRP